ncbi:hypothetical protein LC605_05655 [Nostoc sp. CHAB 5836]|uniref:hypothetical protein n=1 Tax=Nostoc sp. CHAB 5836 TaxID=2780404 RepID=UPI001E2E2640|nr:hypothetical protein [Nostoc sp. CHAB 5836]MCC5614571.1 hypothetical protein [Nostoc sp. CHAB 5836]
MNTNQDDTKSSQEGLLLPEPDTTNITVLTHNLPNTPIIPWNRFDSPSLNKKLNKPEQSANNGASVVIVFLVVLVIAAVLGIILLRG